MCVCKYITNWKSLRSFQCQFKNACKMLVGRVHNTEKYISTHIIWTCWLHPPQNLLYSATLLFLVITDQCTFKAALLIISKMKFASVHNATLVQNTIWLSCYVTTNNITARLHAPPLHTQLSPRKPPLPLSKIISTNVPSW